MERKYQPGKVQERYDLFLYNRETKSNILRRITETPLINEIKPMEYEKGYITFLSDQNGIYNRYIGWFDSTISFIDTTTHYRYFTNTFAITDYSRNIINQDVVPEIGKLGQEVYKNKQKKLQIYDIEPVSSLVPVKSFEYNLHGSIDKS